MAYNKLIIIGNGFDLAHGLATSYNHFITWHLNNIIKNIVTTKKHHDALIECQIIQNQLPTDLTILNSKDFIEKTSAYNIPIKYQSSFFSEILTYYSEANWVDIETYYFRKLYSIFSLIPNSLTRKEGLIQINELNSEFDYLKLELEKYLSLIEQNGFEKNQDINLNLFIEGVRSKISYIPQETLFLNFNYTNTIGKYLSENQPNVKQINIHGKLNDKSNPIIFGYGDEIDERYEQMRNFNENSLLAHIKSFDYFKTNNYRELMYFLNNGKYSVEIMGHSCGISDRVLLNTIFEHKNCDSIRIFYYQHEKGNDFIEKTREISRHFSLSNAAGMRNKIIPFSSGETVPLTGKKIPL